ncbi:MAG: iron-containing alcohol dehydrogenase [Litorilinea sp.]
MSASRGWSHSSQAKSAAEIDIRYGHQLLAEASASWPRYLAITSPTAYRVAESYLATAPADVAYIRTLDVDYLQQVAEGLPNDAELVIGIGGGQALDAAKHMAVAKDLPLILVPTIVSTGAIIHGHCPGYSGNTIVGDRSSWVWADCEYVLIDYDLALEAPIHLHTAGLGDVLCGFSAIAEWRRNRQNSAAPIPEHPDLATLEQFFISIVDDFPPTLNAAGELTDDSVRFIMHTLQQRDLYRVRVDTAPSVDHAFLFALQEANNRTWIHGEIVAFATLIICWNCNENAPEFANWLDRCRVRRRPSQLDVSAEELQRGLAHLAASLAQRPDTPEYNSVMRAEPIDDTRFAQLWTFLESV